MTAPRLKRLFAADGRCLGVAIDHGLFGEPSWLDHIRDMDRVILSQVVAGPDAMTLAAGQAPILQSVPGPGRPALVMRADVTNAYLADRRGETFCVSLADAVDRAVALDAACIVAAVLDLPDRPELYAACMRNVDLLRAASARVGMPLMIEILAMTARDGVPGVVDDALTIATLARPAAELGADVIKTDPTAHPDEYAAVVQAAGGVPVLCSGGSPVLDDGGLGAADAQVLRRTEALLAAGASGVVYGRPVIWAADPPAMTRALAQVIHDGLSADAAIDSMMSTIAPAS